MRCRLHSMKRDLELSISMVQEEVNKLQACVDRGCDDLQGALLQKQCILGDMRKEWKEKYHGNQ